MRATNVTPAPEFAQLEEKEFTSEISVGIRQSAGNVEIITYDPHDDFALNPLTTTRFTVREAEDFFEEFARLLDNAQEAVSR